MPVPNARRRAPMHIGALQVLGGFVPQPPVGFPMLSLTRYADPLLTTE